MHRCAVHKLTNWHTRIKFNTKGAVTLRLQVRDMVTQMHLIMTLYCLSIIVTLHTVPNHTIFKSL